MQVSPPGFFSRGKISLPPSPDLTIEAVRAELTNNYARGRYEVYTSAMFGVDLVIKKSMWTGLAVKIKHAGDGTQILFNPFAPSAFARIFLMGAIPMLILYFGAWKDMVNEFSEYARSAGPFQR